MLVWYQMKDNDTNSTHKQFQLDRGLSSRDTALYSCTGQEGRESPKTPFYIPYPHEWGTNELDGVNLSTCPLK